MESPDPEADAPGLFFDALDSLPDPLDPPAALPPEEPSATADPPPEPLSACPTGALRRRRRLSKVSDSLRQSKAVVPLQGQSSEGTCRSTLTSDHALDNPTDIGESQPCIDNPTDIGESQPSIDAEPPPSTLLISIAGLIIKAIFLQLNLLITCLRIPICLLSLSFSLATDPFGTLKQGLRALKDWFFWAPKIFIEKLQLSPSFYERLGGQQGFGKLAGRLAWGFFCSFYVGFVLFGLLLVAFLGGRTVVRRVVEKPVQLTHELSFDYTKARPDALVPLVSCIGTAACGSGSGSRVREKMGAGCRLLLPGHKLQLIVSLTLPESDYNRKLGMFQVRAELLSANGKITSSSSQPCMLRFKSHHIHLLETFLKSGTLLAGYSSESQTLKLKMTGFMEGIEPTVCTRVILEQRAEYKPNAGIPEIYAASLKIESELPLLKQVLWNWKWTVFIWISMGLYILELLIVLVCCRPVIIPRVGLHDGSSNRT